MLKKALKILAINGLLLGGLLLLAETGLRWAGYQPLSRELDNQPGMKRRYESIGRRAAREPLKVYPTFFTNKEGLFLANRDYFSSPEGARNNPGVAVNEDGFRGSPFRPVPSGRPRLLMVGDSFTWGASARPITESFPDLVERAGYHVCNGGIPGTAPNHYRRIVEKYIGRLKPGAVVVCLYTGNDLRGDPDLLVSGRNLHYITNFGFIRGYDEYGRFFDSGEEAVAYIRKRFCGWTRWPWDYFLYQTVTGKAVFRAMHGKPRLADPRGRRWVADELAAIRSLCLQHGSRFLLFVIPKVPRNVQAGQTLEAARKILAGFPFEYPADVGLEDYCDPPDNHFNNQGHRKMAGLILRVLQEQGLPGLAAPAGVPAGVRQTP